MRSWLFVPADSERKLAKAADCGADALILDLEDSVAPERKAEARALACSWLQQAQRGEGHPALYVRVNALDTGLTDADLDAVLPGRPDGIMLPKTIKGEDVTHADAKITAREALNDLPEGATRIAVVATETAASLFTLASYSGCSARLEALTWGAEDLSADIGAQTSRDDQGGLTPVFELARAVCLAGAVAAGVQPVDTVFVNFRDEEGLRRECSAAMRDGFTGKLAIHPAQVAAINEIFSPSPQAIEEAQAVLAAFAGSSGTGVASLNGQMLDRPHQTRAEKLLERARQYGLA